MDAPASGPQQLLAGLEIVQVAVVVRDLDAYAARHALLVNNGPWRVYEFGPHRISRYEHRGAPATGRTLLALNDGHPQTELLQPLGGSSPHQEWLDRHGEGSTTSQPLSNPSMQPSRPPHARASASSHPGRRSALTAVAGSPTSIPVRRWG